jgi:hypothetical protein
MGYPNEYDQAWGRTGSHLMVHGACSSAGCYSMTDEQVEQIYAFARDAFRGGQKAFQVQAFPFRMTAENMARYKDDPNFAFWSNLKEGYDHFEITKVPPKVDVCGRRYVFNQIPLNGGSFAPTAACPVTTQSESLQTAYQSYQKQFESAFSAALERAAARKQPPAPSIRGFKEAALVADWSRRRARGEKVTREPPSLEQQVPQIAAAPEPRPEQPAAPPEQIVAEQANVAIQAASGEVAVPSASPQSKAGEQPNSKKGLRRLWGLFSGG